MAAATGIWSHTMAQTAPQVKAMDTSGGDGGSDSSGDSAVISANDFLTLLVTEMQNQDPTADTDPNEYINQLVNVNSLEQLISINQTLSGALGTSTPTSGDAQSPQQHPTAQAQTQAAHAPAAGPAIRHIAGNLGVPAPSAAADRVAHALSEKR